MRIISFHIDGFGKLTDFPQGDAEFELREGLNTVLQENGWGKSTIAAFIRCMLYGLENDRKQKNAMDKDRYHFAPWRGGAFGGRLTIEANGKIYRIVRSFGLKTASEDTFDLYLVDYTDGYGSLIPCRDYSDMIGEELFEINSESFRKTIFIGQQDGGFMGVPDSVNAKLGNITEDNDLERCENALDVLDKMVRENNPRGTRNLYKNLKDEETSLRRASLNQETLSEQLAAVSKNLEAALAEQETLAAEEEKLIEVRKRVSRGKDEKAVRDVYTKLCEAEKESKEALKNAKNVLEDPIPEQEDISEAYRLSAALEKERNEVNAKFQTDSMNATINLTLAKTNFDQARLAYEAELNRGPQNSAVFALAVACIIIGSAVGIGLPYFTKIPLLCLVGVVIALLSLLFIHRASVRKKQFLARLNPLSEREAQFEKEYKWAMEYKAVMETGNADKLMTDLKKVLFKLGYTYGPDSFTMADGPMGRRLIPIDTYERLTAVLRDLENRLLVYQEALKHYESDHSAVEEYEAQNPLCKEAPEAVDSDDVTLGEIEEKLRNIRNRNAILAKTIEQAGRDRERYAEQLEEAENAGERLEQISEELQKCTKLHETASIAYRVLGDAKEAFTRRYSESIWNSFTKYYRIITGQDPTKLYNFDSKLSLSVMDNGKHDIDFLSVGYGNLVGFCMRLALIDAMYEAERPMLILDEAFASYDRDKEAAANRLLAEVSNRYQIIYFTCK